MCSFRKIPLTRTHAPQLSSLSANHAQISHNNLSCMQAAPHAEPLCGLYHPDDLKVKSAPPVITASISSSEIGRRRKRIGKSVSPTIAAGITSFVVLVAAAAAGITILGAAAAAAPRSGKAIRDGLPDG